MRSLRDDPDRADRELAAARQLVDEALAEARAASGLTPREGEVLARLVEGMDNRAIGQALYISEDTVKSHVKAIFRKLGARDRGHAIAIALRKGLAR